LKLLEAIEERESRVSFDSDRLQTDDPLFSLQRQKGFFLEHGSFSDEIEGQSVENHSTQVHEIAMHGLGKIVRQRRGKDGRYYFGDTATTEFTYNGVQAISEDNAELAPERMRREIEHREETNITNDVKHFSEMGMGALKAIWSLDAANEQGDMLMDHEDRLRLGYEGRAMIRTHRLSENMSEKIMQSWCVFDLDMEVARAACKDLYGEDVGLSAAEMMSYFADRLPTEDDQLSGYEYIDKVMTAFIAHTEDSDAKASLIEQRRTFLDVELQYKLEVSSRYYAQQLVEFEQQLILSEDSGYANQAVQSFLEQIAVSDNTKREDKAAITNSYDEGRIRMNDRLLRLAFEKKYYAIQITAGISVGNQKMLNEAKSKYGQGFIDSLQEREERVVSARRVGHIHISDRLQYEMQAQILNSSMSCSGGCALEINNSSMLAAQAISAGIFNSTTQLYESQEKDQKVCECASSVKIYDGKRGYCTSCQSVSGVGKVDRQIQTSIFEGITELQDSGRDYSITIDQFKRYFLGGLFKQQKRRSGGSKERDTSGSSGEASTIEDGQVEDTNTL